MLVLNLSKKVHFQQGFTHILVLIAIVALAGLASFVKVTTKKEFPTTSIPQNVLGEHEEAKQSEEQTKESTKKTVEQQKESQTKQKEQQTKSETQTESKKSETEIETSTGQKIKTKTEDDGTTKVEIEHGRLKLKYETKNGVLKLKAENGQGENVDVNKNDLGKIEDGVNQNLEKEGIEIATSSGKPVITKNKIAALTDFPLSIDIVTNQLIVTTPAGQKVVSILPDQAVKNLLLTGIINKIEAQPTDQNLANQQGNLDGVIALEVRDNEVVYKVKGTKQHKILGFIPITTNTTVFISATNGKSVAQEQSFLANAISFLSP